MDKKSIKKDDSFEQRAYVAASLDTHGHSEAIKQSPFRDRLFDERLTKEPIKLSPHHRVPLALSTNVGRFMDHDRLARERAEGNELFKCAIYYYACKAHYDARFASTLVCSVKTKMCDDIQIWHIPSGIPLLLPRWLIAHLYECYSEFFEYKMEEKTAQQVEAERQAGATLILDSWINRVKVGRRVDIVEL